MKWNAAVLGLLCAAGLPAQCIYPCWRELAVSQFRFQSFSPAAAPPAAASYEFSLPYPVQARGAMSEACHLRSDPAINFYRKTGDGWEGPLAGPVYRNPENAYVSGKIGPLKGMAVQFAFSGGAVARGGTLAQSVFFHDEPCYHASTEFGFDRYLQGSPHDGTVYFYYEIHANCKPDGKCRDSRSGAVLLDRRESIPLATPAHVNSRGGADWLYEAYLEDGGTLWVVRVRDPYTHKEAAAPLRRVIRDFWIEAGKRYFEQGAEGYITAVAEKMGVVPLLGAPPVLNVAKIRIAN